MCSNLVIFFSVLKFCLGEGEKSIKTNNANIIGDGKTSVLWHSMENRVNFIRHITSIMVLCLAKLKPEHCSQQNSPRYVFIEINCYGVKGDF